MNYYNINNSSEKVSFREAVIQGISSNNGLFMPERVPQLDNHFIETLPTKSLPQIAFEVGRSYVGKDIPDDELWRICQNAFNFPIELVSLSDRKYALELFHGPTLAFKDFGARFMAGCLGYFSQNQHERTVVLVATSGDTGSAVAHSFLGVPGVDVVILYPSGRVSKIQEKQLTSLGQNITAIAVNGTFDDCQAMVKVAFERKILGVRLTSANSINIARLIPQSFYYYWAVGQLGVENAVISVPSGNFGNITGAMLAWASGLPVGKLVAATNANSVVPEFLETGVYTPRPSVDTISNAMDVGNPSNFSRFLKLCHNSWGVMQRKVQGCSFSDSDVREHIRKVHLQAGYTLDPHGAVASLGLDHYLYENKNSTGIFVETAHPAKFIDTVQGLVDTQIEIPERLLNCLSKPVCSILISPSFNELEAYLSSKFALQC